MSLNVWGGATTVGTPIKLYERTPKANNTHFEIVSAGGYFARPEKGDRGYHIICANSGLYLCLNDPAGKITAKIRPPLDTAVRWNIAHVRNGAYAINNVNGDKKLQLNVRGAGKESGTEVISYAITGGAENAQFILKPVVQG
ncbi:hypothetical protein G6011_07959 [Alternaria panax]|uniref:Ricin B lectin domain-containing protein n=1 Tax=Alternaria panax TaxID=48097 RepID=A0AAD4I1C5_9PLEO|nr:hypothetical protein G6011_07959 [Alternaria panax]